MKEGKPRDPAKRETKVAWTGIITGSSPRPGFSQGRGLFIQMSSDKA